MLQRLWSKVETPFLFSLLKALGLDVQEELECLRVFRYQEKGSQYFWNLESRLVLAQHVIPLALVVSLLVVLALLVVPGMAIGGPHQPSVHTITP